MHAPKPISALGIELALIDLHAASRDFETALGKIPLHDLDQEHRNGLLTHLINLGTVITFAASTLSHDNKQQHHR